MKCWRWSGTIRMPRSPPSRGAWIEINFHQRHIAAAGVAPLAGGVD